MGIITKIAEPIARWYMQKNIETYASTSLPFSLINNLGYGVKSKDAWLRWKKYNPRLNANEKIANDIASTKIMHVINEKEIYDSPAINLIRNPNNFPGFSGFNLIKITQLYYDLVGEAFWIVNADKRGRPVQIIPVPPTWVQEVPLKEDDPYIVRMDSGQVLPVPPNNMVYFKNLDIENPFDRGHGTTVPLGDELQTDEYMAKHQGTFFKQGAKIPFIAALKGAQQEDIERAKQKYMQEHAGVKNSHMPWFLPAESVSVVALSQSMKDLDFIKSRLYIKDTTREFFFIPAEILGDTKDSNRATITAAQTIYAKNTLLPRLNSLINTLNNQYLPMFKLEGEFEAENIVPEDADFNKEKALEGWNNGLYTRNEARVMMGDDPTNDGNVYKVKFNESFQSQSVDVEENNETNNDNSNNDNEPKDDLEIEFEEEKSDKKHLIKIIKTEDFKTKFWNQVDKAAENGEDKFIRELKKFFQNQQNRINSNVDNIIKSFNKSIQLKEAPKLDEVMDYQEENKTFSDEVLRPQWTLSAMRGFEVANESFNFGLSWDLVRDEFLQSLNDWGLKRASEINDTTRKALLEEIKQGIENGESNPQIRDRINKYFDYTKEIRSMTIARTETHNATVGGTHSTYKSAGITQKEWLATRDGRERDWHGSMDGQLKEINQAFVSGQGVNLQHPGDPLVTQANEIVNCRCAELPVIDI
ncbi:MAG: phage portal protein [Firmicutes bacterium]|nr:phage portal protein [Bacillota bacterium]